MGGAQSKRSASQMQSANLIKAAILIQRWHRRHLARLNLRRRYTWKIFQKLEYASEQDQAQLYGFFNDLLTVFPEEKKNVEGKLSETIVGSKSNIMTAISTPDSSYRGPHLTFPLAKKDIDILIDLFRKNKSTLHAKYVAQLLNEAATKLQQLPNLNMASTTVSKQITIIGDLHGKLEDLLVIFHKNGLPSIENPYVFNGDYVDRGSKGLEVFLLVLSCFLAFPSSVFLNRGNHEDTVMNGRYGFLLEVQKKCGQNAEHVLKFIEEVYRWLPLGSLVNNKVLIVHGGISDTTNLDLLKRLNRGKYKSILRPPIDVGSNSIDKVEWKQLFDIMWSDPQQQNGCIPNTARGAGTYFGPDITAKFLARYHLTYLIRSHECKIDGHEFTHNDSVITIFSASNYYAIGSNRGAYMKLNPQLDPYFVQYISAVSKSSNLTFEQRVGVIESSALRELGARLRAHTHDLKKEFRRYDVNRTGQIPANKWCQVMEKITNLEMPWYLLSAKLAPGESIPNYVNYKSTLELLETDIIIEAEENEISVADSLYKNKSALEAIFHILDKDHSGFISLEEFEDAIEVLQQRVGGLKTKESLLKMCKLMDIDGDGYVDINEFLEAFRLSYATATRKKNFDQRRLKVSEDVQAAAHKIAVNTRVTKSDNEDIDPTDYEVNSTKREVEQLIQVLRAHRLQRK